MMTPADHLSRKLRRLSTARLRARQARVDREMRANADLWANSPVLESYRDEAALIRLILEDRATPEVRL